MKNVNETQLNIINKIYEDTILVFDMDGTLVDTDFANFLSYKKAILSIIQTNKDILFNPNERFNRTTLKRIESNLTEIEYQKIIQQKEENYKEYLSQTQLNKSVVNILIQFFKTNKTVLVTNCREDRALITLDYHNLTDKFSNLLFRQISDDEKRTNKYINAVSILNLSANKVVVFENEKQEIEDAILAGIPIENILII
ncbi:HAD hydrolase-like protein [Emticicia sp. SJ17W-69]|uniref:HAD hydrolase-like protein n=1 Tax=Emticicia sp. SJ17W-69 TaxID=3421657 RepID=UPI003EB86879